MRSRSLSPRLCSLARPHKRHGERKTERSILISSVSWPSAWAQNWSRWRQATSPSYRSLTRSRH